MFTQLDRIWKMSRNTCRGRGFLTRRDFLKTFSTKIIIYRPQILSKSKPRSRILHIYLSRTQQSKQLVVITQLQRAPQQRSRPMHILWQIFSGAYFSVLHCQQQIFLIIHRVQTHQSLEQLFHYIEAALKIRRLHRTRLHRLFDTCSQVHQIIH